MAQFTSPLACPCLKVGDSVVRKARETLENAIKMVNESERWKCRVVYGDTDRSAASGLARCLLKLIGTVSDV